MRSKLRLILVLVLAGLGYLAKDLAGGEGRQSATATASGAPASPSGAPASPSGALGTPRDRRSTARDDADLVAEAFRDQRSSLQVELPARVIKLLEDDRDGSRHQRFLVRLSNDRTLLVAHNIDLAPRVPLAVDDSLELCGEYEWNERGGVLHWTHVDPARRHADGWIRHGGTLYQ